MSVRRGFLVWVAMCLLFLVANRAAYKGYFSSDELDNMVQTRQAALAQFAGEFATPRLSPSNFRPLGHLYFKAMGAAAGLNFRWYVGAMHLLHLLNVWLLFLVLRGMGARLAAALGGCAFFAFHMACFDAYWKPMYVFDVLCALFVLLAILLYLRGHWAWAVVPFWMAYKSKEAAVALPAFLLLYEWLVGERRWRRVIPFALISANFVVQALVANHGPVNDYSLRFTAEAVRATLGFYSSQVLLAPYAGALLIALALVVRDRRVWLGLAGMVVLVGPMWFLPGRLYAVYLYVPLIAGAVAFCFVTERWKWWWVAAFFAVWIPANYMLLRQRRGVTLGEAQETRAYVEAAHKALDEHAGWKSIVYEGAPPALQAWGVEGAFYWKRPRPELEVARIDSDEGRAMLERDGVAVLTWNMATRRMYGASRAEGAGPAAGIDMGKGNPAWLFGPGWFGVTSGFRWTGAEARVKLARPARARQFALKINLGPIQYGDMGAVPVEVLVGGRSLGVRTYARQGWMEERWPLAEGPAGETEVTVRAVKPYRPSNGDPRTLGVAVVSLGFVE